MRRKTPCVWAFVLAVLAACTPQKVQNPTAVPDLDALSQKIVRQNAHVIEGDIVQIGGGIRDMELLENLAFQVRKLGAFPLITVWSDSLARRIYNEVPAQYDSQKPELDLKMAEIIQVVLNVSYRDDVHLFDDFDPVRAATVNKAYEPLVPLMMKRNVRLVDIGNGLYPTPSRAEQFEVPLERLAQIFWNGVNADYSQIQKTGESVKKLLVSGKEVHLVNPNGTDLKFKIEKRPVYVSDGIISDEDIKTGGPACMVYLPAGEVYCAPVPGTAEGKIVVDRQNYRGKDILGLTLAFKAGKLESMTAKTDLAEWKADYEAAGAGKDEFSIIDIGINPDVSLIPGSRMESFVPVGMIYVGMGNNTWAGGQNTSNYGWGGFIPNSTLKVDGKVLVEKGVLKM